MQITTGENRRLRWLLKALAKDNRRILQHAHVKGTTMVALDGWRAHFIRTPVSLEPVSGAVKLPNIPATGAEIEIALSDERFPDASRIMPHSEPVLEIHVDPRYLREALEGTKGKAALRFHGPHDPIEVLGKAADDTEVYALVMPKRANPLTDSTWRPYQGN